MASSKNIFLLLSISIFFFITSFDPINASNKAKEKDCDDPVNLEDPDEPESIQRKQETPEKPSDCDAPKDPENPDDPDAPEDPFKCKYKDEKKDDSYDDEDESREKEEDDHEDKKDAEEKEDSHINEDGKLCAIRKPSPARNVAFRGSRRTPKKVDSSSSHKATHKKAASFPVGIKGKKQAKDVPIRVIKANTPNDPSEVVTQCMQLISQ